MCGLLPFAGAGSAHQHRVGDEGHVPRALDRQRHLPLVLGAVPGDPPRDDLPPLGDEVLEGVLILEVDQLDLLGAEAADLLSSEAAAASALLVIPAAFATARTARRAFPFPAVESVAHVQAPGALGLLGGL